MKNFILEDKDKKKMAGTPDFIAVPISEVDNEINSTLDEDIDYLKLYEYSVDLSSVTQKCLESPRNYIMIPIIDSSEKCLGLFWEKRWETIINEMSGNESTQARKMVRYITRYAEVTQFPSNGKLLLSQRAIDLISYDGVTSELCGYQISDGIFILTKQIRR